MLKHGRDFDGWAWETKDGTDLLEFQCTEAKPDWWTTFKPKKYIGPGRWVRVKLVKVEPKKRKVKR